MLVGGDDLGRLPVLSPTLLTCSLLNGTLLSNSCFSLVLQCAHLAELNFLFSEQTESDSASEISFQFNRHKKTPSIGSHSSDMASVSSVGTKRRWLLDRAPQLDAVTLHLGWC